MSGEPYIVWTHDGPFQAGAHCDVINAYPWPEQWWCARCGQRQAPHVWRYIVCTA